MSTLIDDGGPAFPFDWVDFQPTTGDQVVREQFSGMSTATTSRAERLEAALNRIYITAEPGSLIQQIAADALRV